MDIILDHGKKAIEEALGVNLPPSSQADELRAQTRQRAQESLFFLSTAVLGYDKIQRNPHLELCNFIQNTEKKRKVVLIPRDTFKSTVGSKSLPIWILIQDDFCGLPGPEHRILLASFSSENAKKQIKAIRIQIERNQILRWLFPEIIPDFSRTVWTDSNLLFPRNGVYGEDTMEAAGVDTHLVSRHYTVQIGDDLEDLESFQSPTVRRKVKDWYKASEALFVEERTAFHLLIGTRWGVDDVYNDIQANEGDTYDFLVRPLQWNREQLEGDLKDAKDHDRRPTWDMDPNQYAPDPEEEYLFFPSFFPMESCKRVRAKQGAFMYSMLYLNNPRDPSMAEFRESDIQYFEFNADGDISISYGESMEIIPFEVCRRVMFWDPALSGPDKKKNARNAIVVAFKDPKGRIFVVEARAQRQEPTLLFAQYIGLHRRYVVERAAIEDVAFQKVLKFPLYREMREQGYQFPVLEERPIGDKDYRIRSLIPYHESKLLYIRRGQRDLVEEMKGFPLFPTKDLVDALAACIPLLSKLPALSDRDLRLAASADKSRQLGRSPLTGY
jgi:predicted phage terminase large subunit-like protein